eukprot:1903038-Amphidinium_carterae.1
MEEFADEEEDSPLFPGITFAGGGKLRRKAIRSSCSLPSSSWEAYTKHELISSPSCATHQSEEEKESFEGNKRTMEV